ncbi:uncharacterized protein MKZ38_006309 [Zalerion maritima]|uniref:Uncharacterized protein n=1 Tax=Zalerion maritima TaxID=339359 RepID=A0AAD5WPT3_9PEZI|nr:uncharacterized protein MKZ38_006309 [Zalerion maritima]
MSQTRPRFPEKDPVEEWPSEFSTETGVKTRIITDDGLDKYFPDMCPFSPTEYWGLLNNTHTSMFTRHSCEQTNEIECITMPIMLRNLTALIRIRISEGACIVILSVLEGGWELDGTYMQALENLGPSKCPWNIVSILAWFQTEHMQEAWSSVTISMKSLRSNLLSNTTETLEATEIPGHEDVLQTIYQIPSALDINGLAMIREILGKEDIKLAAAAARDSQTMKTITVITLLFLPSTLIASIWDAGIFTIEGSASWKAFLGTTISVTAAVFSVWWLWLRERRKKHPELFGTVEKKKNESAASSIAMSGSVASEKSSDETPARFRSQRGIPPRHLAQRVQHRAIRRDENQEVV